MKPVSFSYAKKTDMQKFGIFLGTPNEYIGYFTNYRIDRKSLPNGWFAYDIRSGEDEYLCTIEQKLVLVDFAGTFLINKKVKFPKSSNYIEIFNKSTFL